MVDTTLHEIVYLEFEWKSLTHFSVHHFEHLGCRGYRRRSEALTWWDRTRCNGTIKYINHYCGWAEEHMLIEMHMFSALRLACQQNPLYLP